MTSAAACSLKSSRPPVIQRQEFLCPVALASASSAPSPLPRSPPPCSPRRRPPPRAPPPPPTASARSWSPSTRPTAPPSSGCRRWGWTSPSTPATTTSRSSCTRPPSWPRSTASGLTYDVRIADLVARGVEIAEINEAYAASVARSPLPSGRDTYRTLADYNADMTRLAAQHKTLVKKFALQAAQPRRPHHLRHRDRQERPQAERRPADVRDDGRPPRPRVALGRDGHGVRVRPGQELRQERADHPGAQAGPRDRRAGREPRRLPALPHRRRVLRPARAQRGRPDRRHRSCSATPGQTYKRKNCRVVDGQDTPDGSCRATAASPGGFALGVDLNRNYGGLLGRPRRRRDRAGRRRRRGRHRRPDVPRRERRSRSRRPRTSATSSRAGRPR